MRRAAFIALALILAAPPAARADISKFDLIGKIYTKWLYRNNDDQGVLNYGNPFWPDNVSGDNGVGSEFELTIIGRPSRFVSADARIKSRFGAIWQDWWENGDQAYGPGEHNTSGESLGQNRAQYIKLRGYGITLKPQILLLDEIRVGSSDLGQFNAWTIGKVRYIDRDNGKGIFAQGRAWDDRFAWFGGIIALPKLWVGPWWSTGVGDPAVRNPFISRDWAYALRLDLRPVDDLELSLVGAVTRDAEIDIADPDATDTLYPECTDGLGDPIPGCARDGAVDTLTRYANAVSTLEATWDLADGLVQLNALVGLSVQRLDPTLVANGVALNDGVSPIVYKDTTDVAARLRVEVDDPFEIGLSFRAEYFNIGDEWNSIFAARREADILWTDGLLGGYQLPTMNLANEFMDFDEAFAESVIGWHGGTVILDYAAGALELGLENTLILYNTDAQRRDVEETYPDFLHTDGYTDVDLFDFANVLDRGRDPRSVYARDQDRRTWIGVFGARYRFPLGRGFTLATKVKGVIDRDYRSLTTRDDDYRGDILQARFEAIVDLPHGWRVAAGGQLDRWSEENRRGTLEQGYGDDSTAKEKAFARLRWDFHGFVMQWMMEYVHKDQHREREPDQTVGVLRSKATAEVSW